MRRTVVGKWLQGAPRRRLEPMPPPRRTGPFAQDVTAGGDPPRVSPPAAAGFTLIEMLVVLTLATILLGIAIPALISTRDGVALNNGRSRVSSAVSVARAASSRYGRTSYLVLDVAADQIRVEADTTADGGQPPVTLHRLDMWSELRLNVRATQPVLCFDPRGLVVASGPCPGTGVVVYLDRDALTDSVVVSSTGRVAP